MTDLDFLIGWSIPMGALVLVLILVALSTKRDSKVQPVLRKEYPFYTYILECHEDPIRPAWYYVGSSEDFYRRLKQHKNRQVKPTANCKYVIPHYVEGHQTREYAERAETKYKNYSQGWLEARGNLNFNLLNLVQKKKIQRSRLFFRG